MDFIEIITSLPNELILIIGKALSLEDLFNLKDALLSSKKASHINLDLLFTDFLEKIDPDIKIDRKANIKKQLIFYGKLLARQQLFEIKILNCTVTNLPKLQTLEYYHHLLNQQNINKIDNNFPIDLRRFCLKELNLTRIPEYFLELAETYYWDSVTSVILNDNKLTKLPNNIVIFKNLKILCLHNMQLKALPETIGQLIYLKGIYCANNHLTALPISIGNLKELKKIDLFNNQITELPETFGNLISLKEFDCRHNKLKKLPNSIGNLTNLQELKISWNQLSNLPDSLGDLISLESLVCDSNRLKRLPLTINKLRNLQYAWVYRNRLEDIPEALLSLNQDFSSNNYYQGNRIGLLSIYIRDKYGKEWHDSTRFIHRRLCWYYVKKNILKVNYLINNLLNFLIRIDLWKSIIEEKLSNVIPLEKYKVWLPSFNLKPICIDQKAKQRLSVN